MKLSDNEIRDITRYLEKGKFLPEKYRFLLCPKGGRAVKVVDIFGNDTMKVVEVTV